MNTLLSFNVSELSTPEPIQGAAPSALMEAIHLVDASQLKAELRKLGYYQFLRTPYWFAVATAVKNRAGLRCQLCNSDDRIQAHHRSYEHHGEEHLFLMDLFCLCEPCHQKHHNIPSTPKKKKHSPAVVQNWIRKKRRGCKLIGKLLGIPRAQVRSASEEEFQEMRERAMMKNKQLKAVRRVGENAVALESARIALAGEGELIEITHANYYRLRCTKEPWHWMRKVGIDPRRSGWAKRAIGHKVPAKWMNL